MFHPLWRKPYEFWNDIGVSKQWQNLHLLVKYYSFTCSLRIGDCSQMLGILGLGWIDKKHTRSPCWLYRWNHVTLCFKGVHQEARSHSLSLNPDSIYHQIKHSNFIEIHPGPDGMTSVVPICTSYYLHTGVMKVISVDTKWIDSPPGPLLLHECRRSHWLHL